MEFREALGGEVFFQKNKKQGTWKGFCTWDGPIGSCSVSSSMAFFLCSSTPGVSYTLLHQFISSVTQSRPTLCDPMDCRHTRPPCPSPTSEACSNSCPLSRWCHPTISSTVVPFSSLLQSFPASGSFPMSQFFVSGGQNIGVQLQHQSFQWIFRTDFLYDGLAGSPLQPKGLSRVSPTPQFKSINSSALSFLYGPTLTSIHDYWKNHSFD